MKNKIYVITVFITIFLISCKENKRAESNNKKRLETIFLKKNILKSKNQLDTIKIREFAKLILENKVYPTDNVKTANCIKQIYTKNNSDLEFYFKVFRVIVKKSDGALAESVGFDIMNFLKFNPDFFIKNFAKFKLEEKNRFISLLAFEFYFSEPNHNKEINDFFKTVSSNLKSDNKSNRKYLNLIRKLVKTDVQKNIEKYKL